MVALDQVSDTQIASEFVKASRLEVGQTTNLLITDTYALALSHFPAAVPLRKGTTGKSSLLSSVIKEHIVAVAMCNSRR